MRPRYRDRMPRLKVCATKCPQVFLCFIEVQELNMLSQIENVIRIQVYREVEKLI